MSEPLLTKQECWTIVSALERELADLEAGRWGNGTVSVKWKRNIKRILKSVGPMGERLQNAIANNQE